MNKGFSLPDVFRSARMISWQRLARSGMQVFLIGAIAVVGTGPARSATFAPPVLGGPEIVKLDWNTRRIVPVDLNQDGLLDLAVINNDRARIEMLLQRAPGDTSKPGLLYTPHSLSPAWGN